MQQNNMDLDVLREKWVEHDKRLEASIRLNRQLLRETYTRRAQSALRRMAAILALGSISLLAVIVSLGVFLHKYGSMPRFLWPAVALDVFAVAALAALNAQIGLALKSDYNQPVATIQKRLETLRMFRIRYSQAIFLTMALTWAPIFIVVMKAFFGVDAYRAFGTAWIVVNVLFGLAFLLVGIWLSKKYGPRVNSTPFGQQLMKDIAGYNLNAATGFLKTLSEFEEEKHDGQLL
jgi:hypothetical protein